MSWLQLFCFFMIGLGIFQIYKSYQYYQDLKIHADQNTSVFAPAALYSSAFMGLVFIGISLASLLNWL
ncbi:putative membrane protein [Latilactobacillus curvatus]|uniref:hypothetical protein n=1 Tax=Latilactobacillus curvatus TaxID=28038 RepID=UPI0009778024|nr:hypothetical protein [Latilactobacillus curvatus]SMH68338.1 putative membrane protein [Latilactobacillus curvatus]